MVQISGGGGGVGNSSSFGAGRRPSPDETRRDEDLHQGVLLQAQVFLGTW